MTTAAEKSPALVAAEKAQDAINDCIKTGRSFRLEAGAGAGKTWSLVEALKALIKLRGPNLLRDKQQIACITYTNVAAEEILSRIDRHQAVVVSTIHAFCWSTMSRFQPRLRSMVPSLKGWEDRLKEANVTDIGQRGVEYELGYPSISDDRVSLGHNDIITLMERFLDEPKFRDLFVARYPILFIDEYQDTHAAFASAIAKNFLGQKRSPLVGFFGDHWQQIYEHGIGEIKHADVTVIDKGSNFRSVPAVVRFLNLLRPELPQEVEDPDAKGSVTVYHTNEWPGARRTEGQWKDDLPAPEAHQYLQKLMKRLRADGWKLTTEDSKILMLTNTLLAKEQNYSSFQDVFRYSDSYLKKENAFIKFLVETLEPACEAYELKRYGEMFAVLGGRTPLITSYAEKLQWAAHLTVLRKLRAECTIGEVLDHLVKTSHPRLPEKLAAALDELKTYQEARAERAAEKLPEEEKNSRLEEVAQLRGVRYAELQALRAYIDDKTPFSTKHGVKGQEFDNVLVVFGRGWNMYNFNQMIEWYQKIPAEKLDTFKRNRNLFYVCCSRAKKGLALLFTQKLSPAAISQLEAWLGKGGVVSLGPDPMK